MKKHLFNDLNFFIWLIIISILLLGCNLFKAGSYANSENYYISISDRELIEKIDLFKKQNPQYRYFSTDGNGNSYEPGYYDQIRLDGSTIRTTNLTDSATFYNCYFYFSDIKARILCVVRLNNDNEKKTNLILVALRYDLNRSGGHFNNGDLSRKEEKKVKRKFETEILDKLGVMWRQ